MYVSHCTVLLMFTGVQLKKKIKKKQNHSFVVVFLWKEKKESDQGCGGTVT